MIDIPPKPIARSPIIENIPDELKTKPQWVLWRYDFVKTKWQKVPYQLTGCPAKSNDATTWSTFDRIWLQFLRIKARKSKHVDFDGIGFMFNNDYIGIDIDDCFDGGIREAFANAQMIAMQSYTEKSVSGRGIHIIMRGALPGSNRVASITLDDGGVIKVEMYSKERFFVFTGDCYDNADKGSI